MVKLFNTEFRKFILLTRAPKQSRNRHFNYQFQYIIELKGFISGLEITFGIAISFYLFLAFA